MILELRRKQHLLQLAMQGLLAADTLAGQLLSDRAAALNRLTRAHDGEGCAGNANWIESVVFPESLVFNGDYRLEEIR